MKKVYWIYIIILIFVLSCCTKHVNNSQMVNTTDSTSLNNSDVEMVAESPLPPSMSSPLDETMASSPSPTEVNPPTSSIDKKSRTRTLKTVPKYEMGKLVYEIPNEMVKMKTYTVVAKISRNLVDVTIYDGMNVTMDTIIRTSELMQIELIDPTGDSFKIVSNTPKQFIDINEPTTWEFFVTPLKKGNNVLKVVVSIIKDGNLKQTVYSDNVIVKTTLLLEIKTWFNLYWQWLFVVILIPLGKYIYTKIKTQKIQ